MNKNLQLYYSHVNTHFGHTYSKDMYEMAFLSTLNSYAIQFTPLISYSGSIHPFSMSSLVFAPSGLGKNASLNFLNPITKQVEKEVNRAYQYRYAMLEENLEDKIVDDPANGSFKAKPISKNKKSDYKQIFDKFPKDICLWSKYGTVEGIHQFYKAYSALGIGSIGIESSELADYYSMPDYKKLLETTAELWNDINPSSLKTTASKGAEKASNIQSSIRLHGSFERFNKSPALFDDLQTFMVSSLARRTLFFYLEKEEANRARKEKIKFKKELLKIKAENISSEIVDDKTFTPELLQLQDNILNVIKHYSDLYIRNSIITPDLNFKQIKMLFQLNKEAEYELLKYSLSNDELAKKYYDDATTTSLRLALETESRHFKALRIAALSCFFKLDSNKIIDKQDVEYAISVTEKSGKYFEIVSKPTILVDNVCKYLYNTRDKTTVKQLEDMEIIPRNLPKSRLNDLWDRTKEALYQNNKIFRYSKHNESIPQVWIEELEETDGEIAHFTYSTEEQANDAVMIPMSCPIYDILRVPDIKKISTGGFANDHRSIDNVSRLGNALIFDVDNGDKLSIKQAMDRLKGLCGFIYPTKHYNKPKTVKIKTKEGEKEIQKVCERYRIVLLCKQRFPFGENKEQAEKEFKQIYELIGSHYEIPYDPACKDLSRFMWIPEEAKTELIINKGRLSDIGKGSLIDLRYYIKDLKMFDDVRTAAKVFDNNKYWKSIGIKGILEKCIINAIQTNNRNNALLIMALRLKDYGLDYKTICDYVYDVDSKFNNPIHNEDENEIDRTILATLKNRMIKENCLEGKNKK